MLCRGHVFTSAITGLMLYGSMTWAATVDKCSKLARNDSAIVWWICSTCFADRVPMAQLRERLVDELVSQGRYIGSVMYIVCTMIAGKRS